MSDIDDLDFEGDEDDPEFIPPDAFQQLLDELEERGIDTDDFRYLGFNVIPQGEGLRGTIFNSPGEAFDHFRNAGVPARMIHLVWGGNDYWRVYISGSP